MIFPFSLYSDFWNIFVLLIDSMDFPSMGLMTLESTNVFLGDYMYKQLRTMIV